MLCFGAFPRPIVCPLFSSRSRCHRVACLRHFESPAVSYFLFTLLPHSSSFPLPYTIIQITCLEQKYTSEIYLRISKSEKLRTSSANMEKSVTATSKVAEGRCMPLWNSTTKGMSALYSKYSPLFRDAEDAVRGRDGYDYDGNRIRVEHCKGGSRGGPGRNFRDPGFRGTQYADRISGGYRRGGSRRTDFRVIISGMPTTGSWQDLKVRLRYSLL